MTAKQWKRALVDVLRAECPTARIEQTASGHLRIVLTNGRCVYTSGTPSDWRVLLNTRAKLRRAARQSR